MVAKRCNYMTKRIISAAVIIIMVCLCITGCGCQQSVPTTIDSDDVAKASVEQLMEDLTEAFNNGDKAAYTKLTTDRMRASDCDINKYFDNIREFIVKEIAFDTGRITPPTYEMLIHYYITFDKDYKGNMYKTGINNMTDRFVIVKEGEQYKLDNVIRFGSDA